VLIEVAISRDRNMIKKKAEKILTYREGPHNRNSAHVECESKSDTGNNRGNWNHLETIQTMP
jgi:hypothetical protein